MSILKTDYKDDVINEELATDRKFSQATNSDGTFSYTDQTPYTQEGDEYGAKQINEENAHCNFAIEEGDKNYQGVDLTVRFAEEIAKYSDPWRWIKARLAAHNLDGIHVHDFMTITVGSYTMKPEILGINTYTGTTDQELGWHIDWGTKDCYPETVKWFTENNNNGTSANAAPYLKSTVKSFLDGLVSKLPKELQSVISSKRFLLENRYSGSGTLTDSNSWGWADLGKLWIPSEYEVFGSVVWGTKGWSAGQAVQYPAFANSFRSRIKGAGDGGSRAGWWLLSVYGGNSTYACIVYNNGHAINSDCTDDFRVPLCFRITE